jgi:hypothetical protein
MEEKGIKKPSYEWAEIYEKEQDIIILDPDGWDRSPEGWKESWNEPIAEDEFSRRLALSTCQFGPKFRNKLKRFKDEEDSDDNFVNDFLGKLFLR